ncbi:MAG: non-ribosomal peptide synthetase, partial [Alphaproteobacteria bacterium]|nr:non-ribosomal peptide synthetase [Alphaproteobacteria bacterium]
MYSRLFLLEGLYDLINRGIKIWVNDNNIQLFVPTGTLFTEEQKNFIRLNKDDILVCLKDNNVFNKEYNYIILKSKLNHLPLSFAQQRLWFIEQYTKGTNAYNVPIIFKLANNVNLSVLDKSIKEVVTRHDVLRTLIKEDSDGNNYQLTLELQECPLNIENIEIDTLVQLDQALSKQLNHIFDLSNEYPIKVCLYKLHNSNTQAYKNEYYLSIVIHHIAFDGWSTDIFLKELRTSYNYYIDQSQTDASTLSLPSLTIQYKDFALWQKSYLNGERLEKQLKYWKEKLHGYEKINLVADHQRPKQINYCGHDIYFEIKETASTSLRELAKELDVSLFSIALSAYYLMLKSYSNQNDLVIGVPIANRHYPQVENLIGFFVNAIALRIKIDSKTLIKDFIRYVNQEVIEAQIHQDLPFEKLVEELKISQDTSRHPIFQVMFGVQQFGSELLNQNERQGKENKSEDILQTYTEWASLYKVAKFDISTFIDDSNTKLKGSFNYATSLYSEEIINGFINTYIQILKEFAGLAKNKEWH